MNDNQLVILTISTRSARVIGALLCALCCNLAQADAPDRGLTLAFDDHGVTGPYNVAGATDPANPFFASLGTNGRSC